MGIDDKYGPICLSIVRENIERMAVLGHSKELAKCGIIKYQYRIILRTVDVSIFCTLLFVLNCILGNSWYLKDFSCIL